MPKMLEGIKNIYFSMSAPSGVDIKKWDRKYQNRKNTRAEQSHLNNLLSLDNLMHEMRLIKEDVEMNLMKKAASITTEAHKGYAGCYTGMYEYQFEAEYLYAFNKNGQDHLPQFYSWWRQ